MRLSIIMPVYNEAPTVGEVVRRVLALPLEKELIVVDDGSTDGTAAVLEECAGPGVTAIRLERNRGKGAAIRAGLERASGDHILIQDADLELSPEEIPRLLQALDEGHGPVVYGSRFLQGRGQAGRLNYLGNRLLTSFANLLYGRGLTDISTAYKLFPRSLVGRLDLRSERFEFCPEITAKLLRLGLAIHETPVAFTPRSVRNGKKIRYLRDGLRAGWALLRWRFWKPLAPPCPVPCTPSAPR